MSNNQISENSYEMKNDTLELVAGGVYRTKIVFVSAYFVDTPEFGDGSWVLVDTGLPLSDGKIRRAAEIRYGDKKPSAIVLTHGHFDHAGAARALLEDWRVPIYAHLLELPYLTGKSDYPPQDPTVGGAIAQMSRLFPHSGYDLGDSIFPTPEYGEIAELPGWKAFHTPGHTAGHISLWREKDRTLLAGDALATMNLDSWVSQITEKREFCNPPAPFTTDWQAAQRSVEFLASLEPKVVGAGHGNPIADENTAQRLKDFARNFQPPFHGRYVGSPAITDERGVVSVPPPATDYLKIAGGAVAAGVIVTALARESKRRNN